MIPISVALVHGHSIRGLYDFEENAVLQWLQPIRSEHYGKDY